MKKLIAITTVMILMLTLCACTNEAPNRLSDDGYVSSDVVENTDATQDAQTNEDIQTEENDQEKADVNTEVKTEDESDKGEADSQTEIKTEDKTNTNKENNTNTKNEDKTNNKQENNNNNNNNNVEDKTDNEQENTATKTEDENYYINDNNNVYDVDTVSVKPHYVYWKDGKLIAECFVINGFSHNVYNINIKSLSFSNDAGVIASGGFGVMGGVTLAPYTHIMWTFEFTPDCVENYGADLSRLICKASVSNNF